MLRELRADLLPGHSFWTSEAAAPVPSADSNVYAVGQAGVKSGSKGGNKNTTGKSAVVAAETTKPVAPSTAPKASAANPSTCGSVTLKKAGLRGERGLVVELLRDSQAKTRPPAGAFRVWVQELLNPGAAEVSVLNYYFLNGLTISSNNYSLVCCLLLLGQRVGVTQLAAEADSDQWWYGAHFGPSQTCCGLRRTPAVHRLHVRVQVPPAHD